jgi:RNA polymerase sigma-70 factor (ECF subfamily)
MAAHSKASDASFDAVFGCTRWSLVMALRDDAGVQRDPLGELTRSYCYPVYAYLRRRGHGPARASQLLLGFFERLGNDIARVDPTRLGRFRSFLLDRLQAFAEGADAADGAPTTDGRIDFAELERRLADEHAGSSAADTVFARSFALQVLSRGRERLHEEAQRSQRGPMFDLLEAYLTRDPSADVVAELAARLGIGSLAVQMAIRRLRQRFRQLVDAELQETVSSPADLEAERAALHRILSRQA